MISLTVTFQKRRAPPFQGGLDNLGNQIQHGIGETFSTILGYQYEMIVEGENTVGFGNKRLHMIRAYSTINPNALQPQS